MGPSAELHQTIDPAIELEICTLLRDLAEDLQFEKLPKKIKDSPKTIHYLESTPVISDSHL
jgi:hypothetical protein